jgi:hypothetical protein
MSISIRQRARGVIANFDKIPFRPSVRPRFLNVATASGNHLP